MVYDFFFVFTFSFLVALNYHCDFRNVEKSLEGRHCYTPLKTLGQLQALAIMLWHSFFQVVSFII